jgi:predicted RNase H-like nuclease (RuvC/YqgF family)
MGLTCSRTIQANNDSEHSIRKMISEIHEMHKQLQDSNAKLLILNKELIHENKYLKRRVSELHIRIENYGKIMMGIQSRVTPSSEEINKLAATM